MHCLYSLEVGQRVPDLRLLSNDSKDLPDVESEHGIVRSLHWFIEKNFGRSVGILQVDESNGDGQKL